jgi:cytochrome c oxidase subunit 2
MRSQSDWVSAGVVRELNNVTKFPMRLMGIASAAGALLAAGSAQAAQPEPWGLYLQSAASGVATDIHSFSAFTFWIITPITLFVLALLIVVAVRFNAKSNPTPSRTSHNTLIEVVWTVAPILILLVISVPSFRLLYEEQTIPEAGLTVKATGNKWYWSYEYPDSAVTFDSNMIPEADITDPSNQVRLLSVDYPLVVPEGQVVRVQVTGADVNHAFAMPSFGVKIDAIPGRLNETWFKADAPGIYYGQCSELCGQNHAYMPIEIRVVTADQYAKWLEAAKTDIDSANGLLAVFSDENAKAEVNVAAR